ncbi:TLDc domain-containing protein [Entamoeba marina]
MNDNSLLDKVINKSNLYFISFDQKNNVFGGYVNTKIMNINDWTHDHNAFVFSLTQNGVVKNKRYNIKQGNDHYSFCLKSNDVFLYSFGSDITIYKSNVQRSCCIPNAYEYNGDLNPLVANQSSTFFHSKNYCSSHALNLLKF